MYLTQRSKIFYRYFAPIIERFIVTQITLMGLQGSGKTNFAKWIVANLENDYNVHTIQIKLWDYEKLDYYNELLEATRPTEPELVKSRANMLVVVLDDASYMLSRHDAKTDKLLHNLMLIRHLNKFWDKYVVIIICHYSTSVLPILRSSHIRAISSLTSQYEINGLHKYFDLSDLWNFYNFYIHSQSNFHFLVNALGRNFIMRCPLVVEYETRQEEATT